MVSQLQPTPYLQFASLSQFAMALIEEECQECRVSLRVAGGPGIFHLHQLARREILFTAYSASRSAIYWCSFELSPEPFAASQQFQQFVGDLEALGLRPTPGCWSSTGPEATTEEGATNA